MAAFAVACASPASGRPSSTPREAAGAEAQPAGGASTQASEEPAGATSVLRTATFNIQVFGKTKASKPEILAQLAEIIRSYDVIAIQEIKDTSGDAPVTLLNAVNSNGDRTYGMLLSPRSGLQPDDKASQEQYAVFYDTATIDALPGERLFDDSEHDLFQREPYLVHLSARRGDFEFVVIDIHTRPESALAEIGAMDDVFRWARTVFPTQDNFVALGDFNAGCDYASPAQLDALDIRGPAYFWIVPDDDDSNVSATTACAYDRIVTTAATRDAFDGRWGVDRAFTDKVVSDHWPVWAEFNTVVRER